MNCSGAKLAWLVHIGSFIPIYLLNIIWANKLSWNVHNIHYSQTIFINSTFAVLSWWSGHQASAATKIDSSYALFWWPQSKWFIVLIYWVVLKTLFGPWKLCCGLFSGANHPSIFSLFWALNSRHPLLCSIFSCVW